MTGLRSLVVVALTATMLASPIAALPVMAQETGPRSVADLADRLLGSVVNISTAQRVEPRRAPSPSPSPDADGEEETPFQEFFDEFFDREDGLPDTRRRQSLGSGFIISEDGVVITNNHVIQDADEVVVNFADGRKLEAEIVGRDPKTDLAVLKVEPDEPLVPVEFAGSERLRIGDWVMAIGNPFGLGGTVTVGIISARNRDLDSGPYDNFLQTDAAINRGNSGGPLFDMDGNVVGINTAIISPTGGSIGIGFAIPSEIAQTVISQLLEYGETRRGWLGVRIQNVTDDIADSFGMETPRGALIAGVIEEGPAEAAGLRSGDVVLEFDGKPVPSMRELPRIVAESPIGEELNVLLLRDGEEVEVGVSLSQLEETEARAEPDPQDSADAAEDDAEKEETATALGMTLVPLSEARRAEFKIEESVEGVLVLEVAADSKAAEKRVTAGDIIIEVGQRAVSRPADVLARIETLREESRNTALLTLSNASGDLRFTAIRLD